MFELEKLTKRRNRKYFFIGTIIAVLFLTAGFLVEKAYRYSYIEKPNTKKTQTIIWEKETLALKNLLKIETSIKKTGSKNLSSILDTDNENSIYYYVYKNDSLLFWSNNEIGVSDLSFYELKHNRLHTLKNAYCISQIDSVDNYTIVALIKVKNNYSYENEYLQNTFIPELDLDKRIHITQEKTGENIFPIYSTNKQFLFSLSTTGESILDADYKNLSIIFYVIGLLLVFVLLHKLRWVFPITNKWSLYLLSFSFSSILLFVCLWLNVPSIVFSSDWFSPIYFASGNVLSSLGHIVIVSLFVLSQLMVADKIPITIHKKNKIISFISTYSIQILCFIVFLYICYLLKDIVYNSGSELFIRRLEDVRLSSVILLLLPFTWMLSFVFLRKIFVQSIAGEVSYIRLTTTNAIVAIVGSIVIYVIGSIQLFLPGMYFILSLVVDYFLLNNRQIFSYKNITFLTLLSVIIIGWQIISFSSEKKVEKFRSMTENMAGGEQLEHDVFAEILFEDLQPNIYNDLLQTNRTSLNSQETETIKAYILQKYFRGYWTRYNIVVYSYEKTNITTEAKARISFYKGLMMNGVYTSVSPFYFCKNVQNNIDYLAIFDTKKTVYCFEFHSKLKSVSYSYPDLLVESRQKRGLPDNISVSKYKNGTLVYSLGKRTPKKEDIELFNSSQDRFSVCKNKRFTFYVLNVSPSERIVISEKTNKYISYPVFIFYLFVVYLLIGLMILGVVVLKRNHFDLHLSFLSKLQISFIALLIISFLSIFLLSVNFITEQYKRQQRIELRNRSQYIQKSILENINKGLPINEPSSELNFFLQDLSDKYMTDIHVYNEKGVLTGSSQSIIFSKGLIGKLISPIPFFEEKNNFSQIENIGKWEYLSVYNTLKNEQEKIEGFIAVPSFFSSDMVKKEILSFLVVMINVYLIIIILAILISIFINNELAKPIRLLEEKLKLIGFSGKNEKIDYNKDDEIGHLVEQYNLMVDKLAESATLLAKSERELAWKQMARQVAHEINNPLTPMKLTIQQLQRAKSINNEGFDEYFEKSARLLVEQIDNLSRIASAFSNFAKMPDAQKETIDIHVRLESVVELFRHNNEAVEITYSSNTDKALVMADKEQLTQVFNNLLMNALQAIPVERKGKIKVSLEATEKSVRITIQDNGCGIPMEIQDKLFTPNFTTKSSGMGLGLALVKNIVDSTGGNIGFETELNKGTTFFVEFPAAK